MFALLVTLTVLSAASLGCQIYNSRKLAKMSSPTFEQLKADVHEAKNELAAKNAQIASLEANGTELHAALVASQTQVADLSAQLATAQAAAGTPDADVAALDADLKSALDPVAQPVPAPETPPDPAPAA